MELIFMVSTYADGVLGNLLFLVLQDGISKVKSG